MRLFASSRVRCGGVCRSGSAWMRRFVKRCGGALATCVALASVTVPHVPSRSTGALLERCAAAHAAMSSQVSPSARPSSDQPSAQCNDACTAAKRDEPTLKTPPRSEAESCSLAAIEHHKKHAALHANNAQTSSIKPHHCNASTDAAIALADAHALSTPAQGSHRHSKPQ